MAATTKRLETQKQAMQRTQVRLAEAEQQKHERQQQLAELEQQHQAHDRKERPYSRLAQARKRLYATEKRLHSRYQAHQAAQRRLDKITRQWEAKQAELERLKQRLTRFEQDNADNLEPVEAEFRLDAGFGAYENITLLIEMGYEVYIKPYSHRVVDYLTHQVDEQTVWERVGANAEMTAWKAQQLKGCPYPLDVALERFHTGKTLKRSALLHFGSAPVTDNLPDWFEHYNGRQTIEAGIKEGKQVFHLQRIKVRSEPAIYLQEYFVTFAANFIRWAMKWLASLPQPDANALDIHRLSIKRQVRVAAHVSAQVTRSSDGKLLKFSDHSAFAGKVLRLPGGGVLPQARPKSQGLMAFFMKSPLIAQLLR